ncbi:probable peptidyl-tRNA hydrolase 2 [Actinia tenebrosa]|uniref:peptidyl-tRNA hydrolase n=1 Tax=Actinia tenebrosa TaxID=6105 RepID=A0A6P8HFG8_ACTTE|nr:probable peptidyl-tRNA hydrolase 2 [Actinia tenebrosa]
MADARGEEADEALLEQAIKMSLPSKDDDQGGEINSPFASEPKGHPDTWEGPTTLFLGQLQEMGFSKNACIKGLYHTQNKSVDEAASWILNNSDLEDIDEPLKIEAQPDLEVLLSDKKEYRSSCKMVFVVNTELRMGVGKIAAQVGHASVSLYRRMLADQNNLSHIILQWENHGQLKVVVKGNNVAHLMDLELQAEKERLKTYLVYDAGRTQVSSCTSFLCVVCTTNAWIF